MTPIFDPSAQHTDVSAKIVAALERLSHAFRSLLWNEAKTHGLSPIQIQFLVYLLYHESALCRVSHLAREFQLTQPTVSDAVRALEAKGLVTKEPWPGDRRILTIKLTPQGRTLAQHLSGWADVVKPHVERLTPDEQQQLMLTLMRLIASLQEAGIVSLTRMCLMCRFFEPNAASDSTTPYYCRLLEKPLSTAELRFDCPEQEPVVAQAAHSSN